MPLPFYLLHIRHFVPLIRGTISVIWYCSYKFTQQTAIAYLQSTNKYYTFTTSICHIHGSYRMQKIFDIIIIVSGNLQFLATCNSRSVKLYSSWSQLCICACPYVCIVPLVLKRMSKKSTLESLNKDIMSIVVSASCLLWANNSVCKANLLYCFPFIISQPWIVNSL